MRSLRALLVGLCCAAALSATTCGTASAGVAVAPDAAIPTESAQRAAFAFAGSVAAQFGLKPHDPGERFGLRKCYAGGALTLCGKVLDGEVQFRLHEAAVRRFSPRADSAWRTLLGGLRAEFGIERVRECEWELERGQPPRRWGCPPLARAPSPFSSTR